MRRVQLDEPVDRAQRVGVAGLHVQRVGLHQLRVHRPGGVGIILLNRLELVGRRDEPLRVQRIQAIVVEDFDGRYGPEVLHIVVLRAARGQQEGQQDHGSGGPARKAADHRANLGHRDAYITPARHAKPAQAATASSCSAAGWRQVA